MRLRPAKDFEPLFGVVRFLSGVAAPIMALLLGTALVLGVLRLTERCDPDPWACFGAGRYDAMREGRVCECYQKEHLQ